MVVRTSSGREIVVRGKLSQMRLFRENAARAGDEILETAAEAGEDLERERDVEELVEMLPELREAIRADGPLGESDDDAT